MEVGVRELGTNLSQWIARAKRGQEVVITERGKPVARLTHVKESPALERLIAKGIVAPPTQRKKRIRRQDLVKTRGGVSDLVKEQRR